MTITRDYRSNAGNPGTPAGLPPVHRENSTQTAQLILFSEGPGAREAGAPFPGRQTLQHRWRERAGPVWPEADAACARSGSPSLSVLDGSQGKGRFFEIWAPQGQRACCPPKNVPSCGRAGGRGEARSQGPQSSPGSKMYGGGLRAISARPGRPGLQPCCSSGCCCC